MLNISSEWKDAVVPHIDQFPLSGSSVQPHSFPHRCCLFVAPVSLSLSRSALRSTYPDVPKLTDVTFQDVSDTTISLSWSPLNTTAITGYRITVMAAGESVPIFEDFVLPTTGKYTVYGLEPGIDYDITVITVTENGESEPTTITQQTCKSVLGVCMS